MHAQQHVARHAEQRDVEPDERTEPEPDHEDEIGQRIGAVVDEIAVIGPLDLAVARQAPVEGVAEPLHHIAGHGEPQPAGAHGAQRITRADGEPAGKTEGGEAVRRDEGGQAGTEPRQDPALAKSEHIALDAHDGRMSWLHDDPGFGVERFQGSPCHRTEIDAS